MTHGTLKGYAPHYTKYFRGLDPSDPLSDQRLVSAEFPSLNAFNELCLALGDPDVERPPKKLKFTKSQLLEDPLVVLAFDEIHTLANAQEDGKIPWSQFGELRRTIRGLYSTSVFTLFLSTSSTLFSINPPPACDISARMATKGDVMLPFWELGFDQCAIPLNFSEPVQLSRVTSPSYFTSIGRPLYVPNIHFVPCLLIFTDGQLLKRQRDRLRSLQAGWRQELS